MALKAVGRHIVARDPLQRAIEQRPMGHLQCVRKILLGDGEAMVLTGHHHRLVAEILHGVIGAVMTKLHLLGARAAGQRQNLVPQTNPEEWDPAVHHFPCKGDRILARPCEYAITLAREVMDRGIPLFGICLGHQILALASGARTEKMKFGHHGANHPVQNLSDKTVMVTSQNHGFTVSEQDLPDTLEVTHRSLFDGTLQGIARNDVPAYSFQGHPEASPGPHDAANLFQPFIAAMEKTKQ